MIRLFTCTFVIAAAFVSAIVPAAAQTAPPSWPLTVPEPSADSYTAVRDVVFDASGAEPRRLDVYQPRGAAGPRATLVFFNSGRAHPVFVALAKYAAAHGLVAVVPDIRREAFEADVDAMLAHLAKKGTEIGVDPDAIAVYAPSGLVSVALPAVQNPSRTGIKAAVMYYGTARVPAYRLDLPMLIVRAGLDRPPVNRDLDRMVADALMQNAPVSVINNPAGYHAFELLNQDAVTTDVLQRTFEFVKSATAAAYQSAVKAGVVEARAAANVLQGKAKEAVADYATLVAARPERHTLRLAYVEALLGSGEFKTACDEAQKLKGKGLGARDLGLPAARACLQKGDPDAAIAWLKSIPTRFLPLNVQTEPVFAPLKDREDFKALFPPR